MTWGLLALAALVQVFFVTTQLPTTAQDAALVAVTALAFGVAEAVVLHVEYGSNAHSVSMSELVLATGLFFLPSAGLPIARVIGSGLVLLLIRRQRLIKAAFNTCLWLLALTTATAVFQHLGGGLHHGAARLTVPTVAAVLAGALVDSLGVNAVIALTSRELRLTDTVRSLVTCLLTAVGCATLGVLSVAALAYSVWLMIPILGLIGGIFGGFHLFSSLRTRHSDVKILYQFTDTLAASHHAQAVPRILAQVTEHLRASRSELWLRADDGPFQLASMEVGGEVRTDQVDEARVPALIRGMLDSEAGISIRSSDARPDVRDYLKPRAARDAVVAPIRATQGLRGLLVVLDRRGDVATFGKDDADLLQSLAAHAGTTLVNSRLVEQLNYDSSHDSLTGLANRALFQRQLEQVLARRERTAVLLMDLDRFKEVNDTLGHHHGDLLIQQIATRLRAQLRAPDLLARLGGDEFAVLLTGVTEEQVLATAERLRDALAQPMQLQGVVMEVTASIGVVLNDRPGACVDATAMLQRADVSMYAAKQSGAGIRVYEPGQDDHSPRRLALAGSLRQAIEEGQLSLRYQPQARLTSGAIVGVEALVRWEHPTYGEVPPDDFINIAEQTGQIRNLTRAVLAMALQDVAAWLAHGRQLAVSVNVSVRNLLEADLVANVAMLLTEHDVPSRLLTLEITETHLMADPVRIREVLIALGELGVRLSVDDFGTGYSSLSYLKQLPVSEVKIDKSFVRDLAEDSDDAAIVEAIIQLSHTMRLEVVAEGVEDQAAQDKLGALGCDFLQGYYLARPMRADALLAWLDNRTPTQRTHRHLELRSALVAPRTGFAN
jgi:diguanylate cyclase (GGDEF)-like protein